MTGLIILLTACSSTPEEIESLDKTLKTYEKTLRWIGIDQINAFLKKEKQINFSDRERKRLKNIQVTGYRTVTTNATTSKASHVVEIRYFNQEYAIERTITDRQKWEYDKEEERWYLVSTIPRFR